MVKFEYKSIRIREASRFEIILNEEGQDGWLLVYVKEYSDGYIITLARECYDNM